jgi:hypothetical protein
MIQVRFFQLLCYLSYFYLFKNPINVKLLGLYLKWFVTSTASAFHARTRPEPWDYIHPPE